MRKRNGVGTEESGEKREHLKAPEARFKAQKHALKLQRHALKLQRHALKLQRHALTDRRLTSSNKVSSTILWTLLFGSVFT